MLPYSYIHQSPKLWIPSTETANEWQAYDYNYPMNSIDKPITKISIAVRSATRNYEYFAGANPDYNMDKELKHEDILQDNKKLMNYRVSYALT